MDKEIKTKWVKALRSGRYKQAFGALHKDGAYCCLGVLARVQGARKGKLSYDSFLEGELSKYAAGLSIQSQNRLGTLNDSLGWDFKQIADDVEKRY